MVCQAATRTRFRALKHENGIAGSTTIIVRVIACFRPLQDCQVINLGFVLMEKDMNPRTGMQHSPWQFSNMNSASNIQQFDIGYQNTNSMLSPAYVPHGCVFSVNTPTPFPGINTDNPFQQTSSLIPPLLPSCRHPEFDGSKKRCLVFDQIGYGRSFFCSSSDIPFPCFNSMNPGFSLQGSTETNVSSRNEGVEMHEDTEEINALLYSDSDDEEASTGHSPVGALEMGSSEVASSMLPVKRRRVDVEFDASLVDTASSQVFHCPNEPMRYRNKDEDDDTESSFVKGGDHDQNADDRQLKRARIQETVGILRTIIPGGRGKDAASVLDEAIHYLKSLKLKTRSLNATP
ncbi:transcription factor bHLH143-like isoform X1 [Musa acuminata AAA Group]|uniref:transcription factor bHLH143 isoform X1 n=2 Tax=Musa acuminata AAA Group TaxID=214697 RepID=UPI0031E2BA61